MREVLQSNAVSAAVFVVSAGEHITGLTSVPSFTGSASKNGAAFSSVTMTATAELGKGWYRFTLNSGWTDTLGELAFTFSAASADPIDFKYLVVPFDHTKFGYLDVSASSRLAATASGYDKWNYLDVSASSRMAATATFVTGVTATMVPVNLTASASDLWHRGRGKYELDPAASGLSAYRTDNTLLWSWTLSAATVASAVPAFVKATPTP